MQRYFIPDVPGSLRAIVSVEMELPPEIGILITEANQGFRKPFFLDDTYSVVVETITEEEVTQEIEESALKNETYLYLKRINDGFNAVARLSAELRLAKLGGSISEEGHKYIDALLVPIRNEVMAGQWIGAKDLLIELGSEQIGIGLYEKLFSELTAYIEANY